MSTRKSMSLKPATATSANKVVPLRETVPDIEPAEGWLSQWKGCTLRFAAGPGGRLVRLVDVVQWLMQTPRELPLAEAVYAVVREWEGDKAPPVYEVNSVEFASPLVRDWGLADEYFWDEKTLQNSTPAQVAVRRLEVCLIKPHDMSKLVNTPGFDTEYDGRIETPFEYLERTEPVGGAFGLAVDFATAHRLWGWGRVTAPAVEAVVLPAAEATKRPTTWTELIPWPDRKVKGFEWPDDLRLIVVLESKRRHDLKHLGVTASMAKEFGCTDRNMRKVISGKGRKDSRGKVLAAAAAALSNGTDGAK